MRGADVEHDRDRRRCDRGQRGDVASGAAPTSPARGSRSSAVARSTVHGWPSSLLNEPGGATTSPSGASTAASRSLVDVLPDEPVTPTIVSPPATSSAATARRQFGQRGQHRGARAVGVDIRARLRRRRRAEPAGLRRRSAGTPTGRGRQHRDRTGGHRGGGEVVPVRSLRREARGTARPASSARESNSTVPVIRVAAASRLVRHRRARHRRCPRSARGQVDHACLPPLPRGARGATRRGRRTGRVVPPAGLARPRGPCPRSSTDAPVACPCRPRSRWPPVGRRSRRRSVAVQPPPARRP